MKKAFTLVEILIATSIFLVLTGTGVNTYKKASEKQVIESDVGKLETALGQTRAKAGAGVKDAGCAGTLSGWSMLFTDSSYTAGPECGCSGSSCTQTTNLSKGVSISVLPSPNPIIFKTLSGGTAAANTTITLSGYGFQKTISVSASGMIQSD